MTAREIRQSFLDFFQEKQHTVVPSASLMPTSPNLLFTNAGMNQFIPYFLGTEAAPYSPARAADTQKCIRAGGKHNDLDDVGYDTYHHTFFEMLGNWSFGDYFKQEAIEWAWELLTQRWGLPADRLYATVYAPGEGDPAEFDQEAYDIWAKIFEKEGLDPKVHIVNGNKKDNFWMMGETGPCGPCSELHIDLTPDGDTKGSLVNKDDAACIEIWNLVFIQFNANEDGTFRKLPAFHVDTGMGFERVCSIVQGTKGCTDFSKQVSNYDTDVFSGIFDELEKLSGKRYCSTMPEGGRRNDLSLQEQVDIAFRVIGDHIRTVSFSIADGIEPGNGGRNYVIRNILRRAVRFGRILGFGAEEPFLHRLVPVLVREFGDSFPEITRRQDKIEETLRNEEAQFNRTLDRGLKLFEEAAASLEESEIFPAATVVKLWETYGFPTDLTALLLDEKAIATDPEEVDRLVAVHKGTGADGKDSTVVTALDFQSEVVTEFVGFEKDECQAEVLEWITHDGHTYAIVDKSPFYIEKGGQQGDRGELEINGETYPVEKAIGVGEAAALLLGSAAEPLEPGAVTLRIDAEYRREIEKHHTATHLFHWALHEEVSSDATQQGSLVAPDRLRFDFNSKALNSDQIAKIEKLVNGCIASDDKVHSVEVDHAEIRDNEDIMQFFGDKYGDRVRVVQIGGNESKFDGYSMELCGGTHIPNTGALGYFKVKSEGAVSAGIRRIEAVCGDAARRWLRDSAEEAFAASADLQARYAEKADALTKIGGESEALPELDMDREQLHELLEAGELAKVDLLLAELETANSDAKKAIATVDKKAKKLAAGAAAKLAGEWFEANLANGDQNGGAFLVEDAQSPNLLQEILNQCKSRSYPAAVAVGVYVDDTLHFGAIVPDALTDSVNAGEIVRSALTQIGGKGGGKPNMARGAANGVSLEQAREAVKSSL